MSVDYYSCSKCGIGYRDDSDYCAYCECGSNFCNAKCGALHNYGEWNEDDESHRIDDNQDITCIICRKEFANDYILFHALLKHYSITRDDALKIYENQKDE